MGREDTEWKTELRRGLRCEVVATIVFGRGKKDVFGRREKRMDGGYIVCLVAK